jgi:hypothetical protein
MVVDRSVNDNVFAIGKSVDPIDKSYLESAGWNPKAGHTFDQLLRSDNMEFKLVCGQTTYQWRHGYLYDPNGDNSPAGKDWLSGPGDPTDGGGTTPPGLVSASSLQWNMNNTTWDVTLGGTRTSTTTWKSPTYGSGSSVLSTDSSWGYPPVSQQPADAIKFNSTLKWEWPMVYEFSFDLAQACQGNPITELAVITAHNSPAKDSTQDVPLATVLTGFTAVGGNGSVELVWETATEVDNLGFNLYRSESPDGAVVQGTVRRGAASHDGGRVRINTELIPTQTPPGSSAGAVYRFLDAGLADVTTTFYWLESVDISGQVQVSGPISATTK